MQSHKNTPKKNNANHHRKHKPRRQPHKEPVTFNPPAANVQAEEWGSSANPWPETVDESDMSKEIISAWRQNVYAAEHGGELQKMEDLYNRLDGEREKWNERLNNPLTWGWGGGQPDELNDWAKGTKVATGWGDHQPDELNNWTNDAAYEPCHWGGHQQANSDNTPDGPSNNLNTEQMPPPLPQLVSDYAGKLNADGRQRSYDFAQLPTAEAKAEKIREIAYQLRASKKH